MKLRILGLAAVAAVTALIGGAGAAAAIADGTTETTVLKNAAKPTYLATATWGSTPSWIDTAASGELVTYPGPGETGALIVGTTCIPRDQDPVNGGLVRSQPVGDGSTCMRFTAERTSSGTFTFRVAEPGMPADGRYLGDGDGGGFLDLISTSPLTQFIITERAELTVTASVSTANVVLALTGPVTFGFDVANTGNVDVTGLAVTSSGFTGDGSPGPIVCDATVLAPGATTLCRSDYTLTSADEASGEVRLTVTATAVTPSSAVVASSAVTASIVTSPEAPPVVAPAAPQLAATGLPAAPILAVTAALLAVGGFAAAASQRIRRGTSSLDAGGRR